MTKSAVRTAIATGPATAPPRQPDHASRLDAAALGRGGPRRLDSLALGRVAGPGGQQAEEPPRAG